MTDLVPLNRPTAEVRMSRPARCLTKVAGQPCPNRPVWDLLLHCSGGHSMGGGPACADHKHEVENGVPHGTCGGWITLAHAVPL